MRITKKWLKDARQSILCNISLIFQMTDDQLKIDLEKRFPAVQVTGSREETIRQIIMDEVRDQIPDSMIY